MVTRLHAGAEISGSHPIFRISLETLILGGPFGHRDLDEAEEEAAKKSLEMSSNAAAKVPSAGGRCEQSN